MAPANPTKIPKPLMSVRVVDLTSLGPGPFFTQCLVDMGAKVTKIERPPVGDVARVLSPGGHRVLNRDKESCWLDLKNELELNQLRELIQAADILAEGFRPGVMARLGLGYADLAALNPRLIYVSISGYGQTGPNRTLPGHDLNYLAASGFLSITRGMAGGPGDVCGVPIGDFFASLYALSSTLAALLQVRESGKGQWLDVSLTDCLSHVTNATFADLQQRHINEPDAQRRSLFNKPGYGVFRTLGGREISIGALEDNFWQGLVRALALDLPGIEHANYDQRVTNADVLNAAIAAAVERLDLEEVTKRLIQHDVPVMPVIALTALPSTELSVDRGLFAQIDGLAYARFPIAMDGGIGPTREKS